MTVQLSAAYTDPSDTTHSVTDRRQYHAKSHVQQYCRLKNGLLNNTIQYKEKNCNAHNVCQLAELEMRAVTGGTLQV